LAVAGSIAVQDWPQEVLRRVRDIPVAADPFPHFYGGPVFPPEMYERLLEILPSPEEMPASKQASNPYGDRRMCCPINGETVPRMAAERRRFWAALHALLCGPAFIEAVVDKYRPFVLARYGGVPKLRGRLEVYADLENYQIRPHTDAPHKAFNLLFYLPRDRSRAELGTAIYAPKEPSFRSEKPTQFPFEMFDKVRSFDYLPNTVFGFMKTDRSFHGRDPVPGTGTPRYMLNLALLLPHEAGVR